MVKLIFNADDFGLNSNVNSAINYVMTNNLCSNTTLIVNMPASDEAVSLSKKNNYSDKVGLHLNLTQGIPLTEQIKNEKTFCNVNGEFHAKFHTGFNRFYLNKNEKYCVKAELKAQIEKYLEYNLPLLHLDSHHHIHNDLSIFTEFLPLFKHYNFRSMRLSRNMYLQHEMKLIRKLYKLILNSIIRRNAITADYSGSIKDFKEYESFILPNSVVEIMVHPKYVNDILCDYNVPYDDIVNIISSNHFNISSF